MSHNSVKNVGHSLTHMSDWEDSGPVGVAWDNLVHPQAPKVQTTAPPAPTQANANQTALNQELQNEKNMRSTWTMLTGGMGVLDNPQVSSPQLLGS